MELGQPVWVKVCDWIRVGLIVGPFHVLSTDWLQGGGLLDGGCDGNNIVIVPTLSQLQQLAVWH